MEKIHKTFLLSLLFLFVNIQFGQSLRKHFIFTKDVDHSNPAVTCNEKIYSSRPGYCPPPVKNQHCYICRDYCRKDQDCPGNMKCCNQAGCGGWCRIPYPEKPPNRDKKDDDY